MTFLLGLTSLYGLFTVAKALLFWTGHQKMGRLSKVTSYESSFFPKISIVVPIRNEAHTLRNALPTLLRLDYPELEWIFINDRSEDTTKEELDRLREDFSGHPIKILTLTDLPKGWLGKNHALDQGARIAQGDLILFCDADIHLSPDCLKLAVSHFMTNELDHLSLLLRLWSRSWLVDSFIPYFGQHFLLYFRPWEAKDQNRTDRFVGIGAFNLLRKSALEKVGYFTQIRLRPDDDVKLGKVIKRAGLRQDCLAAPEYGSVEWYPNFKECTQGLEKNLYPGTDFRFSLILLGALGCLFPVFAPLTVLIFGSTYFKIVGLLFITLDFSVSIKAVQMMGAPKSRALATPLVAILYAYLLLRNSLKNIYDGGIYWRKTFYPLSEIKKNQI